MRHARAALRSTSHSQGPRYRSSEPSVVYRKTSSSDGIAVVRGPRCRGAVPGLVEARYRGVIEIELRHDSRDALADLPGFEFGSIELFGHRAPDSITGGDVAAATHGLPEIPPGAAVSRPGLVVRGHVMAAKHSQSLCVPAVTLYRSVQILLNTRWEELDDEQ